MKKFYSFLLMMLSICTTTYADNWMQYLPDNAYIVDVSIPGSHDTATGNGWVSPLGESRGTTQDLSLETQWELGARAFDLRPKVNGSRLAVNHGILQTKLYFDDAIRTICGFLKENPTEFVVIHMLYADGFDSDKAKYQTYLRALLNSNDVKDYLVDFRRDLTVKEMRGKMLIISRDPYDTAPYTGGFFNGWGNGIYWNISISGRNSTATLNVQDMSETYNARKEKDNAIRALLDFSTRNIATTSDDIVWSFNLPSAYTDNTSGLFATSTSNGYRENATYTHPTFIDYLKENPAGPTGVVLMDYLGVDNSTGYATLGNGTKYNTRGKELLDTIINNNWRYQPKINKEGKTISVPYYTYKTTGWTSTTGNTFHVNTWSTEGITDGSGMVTPFFENWLNKGGRLGNGEIYYTLSECKKGYYKVSIKTRLLNEAGGTDISGASMFANEGNMEITTGIPCKNGYFSNYSVIGKVNEESGELRFGFKIDNANFNWISFTYVDVEYLGDDEVTVADAGDLMLDAKYEKALKETYKQAQAAFEANPSMETYNALSKAYRDAEPSIEAYKDLAKTLEYANNVYNEVSSKTTEQSKEEYLSIINRINEKYNDEVYSESEIKASVIPQIYAALAALKKSLGESMDMTSLIVNNSFETGDMTGWSLPYGDGQNDTGVRKPTDQYAVEGCDGNYLFNIYWKGCPITQTVTGLPNGRYRLNALVSSDGATIYLIANGGHNEGTETGGNYPGKDIFQEASYEFDVTEGYATIGAVGGDNGTAGEHKPYREDGYWWYKADNFRLTYIDTYLSYVAKPFSGDGELEAGQWYVYNIETDGHYGFSAIEDIEYTIKDALLSEVSTASLPAEMALSAGIIYLKSGKNQSLTITKLPDTDNVTITNAKYTAYVTIFDTDFTQTEGITAYKVTDATMAGATLEPIDNAPKSTAVILNSEANDYTIYRATNAVTEITDNKFLPGGSTSGNGTTIYALGNKGCVGFYLVNTGVEVPANKGYLEITDNNPVEGIKAFIPFGDTVTGIESITAEDDNEESTIYNIAGQRVGKGYKGIVIDKNGKKYLNK